MPTLDLCFENPVVGVMAFHYINVSQLDTTIDVAQLKAMVYAPGSKGKLNLAADKYIVPTAPWDEAGNTAPFTCRNWIRVFIRTRLWGSISSSPGSGAAIQRACSKIGTRTSPASKKKRPPR